MFHKKSTDARKQQLSTRDLLRALIVVLAGFLRKQATAISKVEAYRLLGRCPEDFSPACLLGPVFGKEVDLISAQMQKSRAVQDVLS